MPIPSVALSQLQNAQQIAGASKNNAAQTDKAGQAFGSALNGALNSLSQMQASSDSAIQQLAAGENVDLHQVMIGAEQTDIAFRVAISMRDKLVEAYHEVMRMQV
ncbi:MAG: flagellar hook-basal body complex protein FliE [Chloroflexi bacterium]|nr:flagellar hook-basal body complex protein FliE [Chloroflexota bacterium]